MNANNLLHDLNEKQLEAVTWPHQSALVLAGAGSGKTRVLTTRIAWLIETGQASPAGVLAVTFTNKAAKEMVARLSSMLTINLRGMWIGTFHGLCNRFLRAHHREANLPALFQILDVADQLSAIKRLMKTLNVDDERFPPRQVQAYINNAKEEGLRASQMDAHDAHAARLREIYAEYDAQCQREGVTDFAELLLRSYEVLAREASLRAHYQQRFRYILVDEFQDTNQLQYLWLKLLAGNEGSLFAVGDDDQSIYSFRGARVGNMQDLERDFSIASPIKLEQNYRSHGNILEAANAIITHNRNRLGKKLWTTDATGEPVRHFDARNDIEEADFVVEEIGALRQQGIALSDMALLYRSNAQSRVLEHALFSAGLPYRVHGGLRFFERAEIRHALAYLRLVANPEDDAALLRIINFPARGIGARTLEQLQDAARQQQISLWQAAGAAGGEGGRGKGIPAFVTLVKQLQEQCNGLSLPEMVDVVTGLSGLRQHYKTDKEGGERLANLDELVNAAVTFTRENDPATLENPAAQDPGQLLLASFLAHASLEAGEHQADPGQDALQLMTVHAAKGLEFHSVFLCGLEEGLFPHEQSLYENGLEEERRLMYVAVTRARRQLYLSSSRQRMLHGQTRYNLPSRFLDEIPEPLLKRLNSVTPAGGSAPPTQTGSYPWRTGQAVRHQKFGNGVVVGYEGNPAELIVLVNFGRDGMKKLLVEYAKLETA